MEQDPSCQTKFFFDIHVIYIVSDILTNFYQDPIIRSTKKSLVTDTCNKSPPPYTEKKNKYLTSRFCSKPTLNVVFLPLKGNLAS